jgi:hypothetical protein
MLATFVALRSAFAAAAVASIVIALFAPRGRAWIALIGSMIGFIGIIGIASGSIVQRWGGGRPLEGPLAVFFSVLLVGFGLYLVFLAFYRKSRDHIQRR